MRLKSRPPLFQNPVFFLPYLTAFSLSVLGTHLAVYLLMQETSKMWVRSMGQEDPLEESMATHFNILAWRIPWSKEPGGLHSIGLQRVRYDWHELACIHDKQELLMTSKTMESKVIGKKDIHRISNYCHIEYILITNPKHYSDLFHLPNTIFLYFFALITEKGFLISSC